MRVDDVAGAIADPVRREILAMLREASMSAGQIADRFAISRPAVSRHLRVLRESGLVHDELTGRQRIYRLDPAPLARLAGWLAPFLPESGATPSAAPSAAPPALAARFDALETEVYRTRRERRRRDTAGTADQRPAPPDRRRTGGDGPATTEREERSA